MFEVPRRTCTRFYLRFAQSKFWSVFVFDKRPITLIGCSQNIRKPDALLLIVRRSLKKISNCMSGSSGDAISSDIGAAPENSLLKQRLWWLIAGLNIFFVIAGQTTAILLGRFYYDQGGNSKWVSSFVQTAGFPLLFIALCAFRSKPMPTQTSSSTPIIHAALIYTVLGLIVAADNLMYSYGLLYLAASTYTLSFVLLSWPSVLSSHVSSTLKR